MCSTDGEKFNLLFSSTYFIYSKLILYCFRLNDDEDIEYDFINYILGIHR